MAPKSKIVLAVVALTVAAGAGVIGIYFISQKTNGPSVSGQPEAPILGKTLSPATKPTPASLPPFPGSSQSKDDAAAQIRQINNISNEFNNYNNSANQINASNAPL